jgi:hypothetical protein
LTAGHASFFYMTFTCTPARPTCRVIQHFDTHIPSAVCCWPRCTRP